MGYGHMDDSIRICHIQGQLIPMFKLTGLPVLLQAFSYRGPDNPNEENLVCMVQTSAAAQRSKGKNSIPGLPSGSLITGLAAAAVQYAEVDAQLCCMHACIFAWSQQTHTKLGGLSVCTWFTCTLRGRGPTLICYGGSLVT